MRWNVDINVQNVLRRKKAMPENNVSDAIWKKGKKNVYRKAIIATVHPAKRMRPVKKQPLSNFILPEEQNLLIVTAARRRIIN